VPRLEVLDELCGPLLDLNFVESENPVDNRRRA
jgi:hypothetical protein